MIERFRRYRAPGFGFGASVALQGNLCTMESAGKRYIYQRDGDWWRLCTVIRIMRSATSCRAIAGDSLPARNDSDPHS